MLIPRPGHAALVLLLGFMSPPAAAADNPLVSTPDTSDLPANFLFERYTARDRYARTITFYLSKLPRGGDTVTKQPVALFVGGSGCQSQFMKVGEKVSVGLGGLMYTVLDDKARVLVVEKLGVKFLDNPERPGSAIGASEEYLKEHTLDRWVEANRAALQAVWSLPGIDPTRTLAAGHSEGAGVVAKLAAVEPKVTHIACLAGGGPPQLFDLVELAGKRAAKDGPDAANKARQRVFDDWAAVLADPDSTAKMWMGHPHRRWSTFGAADKTADLLKSKAKLFLAHGTKDAAVPVSAFDVSVATLRANGRAVTAERIDGADHGFAKPDDSKGEGFKQVLTKIAAWFAE
jgi:dienelactone hydrolase